MATAARKKPATPARKRTAPAGRKPAQTKAAAAPAPDARKAAPAPAKPAKEAKAAKAGKVAKADKPKKPKLVRDSFTIPKGEYAVLQTLKDRAAAAGSPAKKSELLRAGIQALAAMQDGAFLAAVAAVPALKTGRPAKA